MIDAKKLSYSIKTSNASIRKMDNVLDNRLILNQCKCMHHDDRAGIALKSLDENDLKKVPTPGKGIYKRCAVCDKIVRIDRVPSDSIQESCLNIDAFIDQQKMMMSMNNTTEEQVEILSGIQTDIQYVMRMNRVSRKNLEKKKKQAKDSQKKSNSGWNMNGVGGWHE